MADLPPDRDTNHDDGGVGRGRASAPRTPRWVLVLGIIAIVLIAAFVVQAVLGGGHGPGMHASSGEAGSQAASSSRSGETVTVS
jgi:hypothetical protein